MNKVFNRFASKVTELSGSSYAFIMAVVLIAGWLVSGPFLGFSDTWQLYANTFTTLVTFLMVFLIQNSQNREQQRFEEWLKDDLKKSDEVIKLLKRRVK